MRGSGSDGKAAGPGKESDTSAAEPEAMKMHGEPRTAGDSTWTSGGAEHSAAARDDMTGQRAERGKGTCGGIPGRRGLGGGLRHTGASGRRCVHAAHGGCPV
eukprot:scaffold155_cov106-Isochrysis_galbana.AAC.3